jgi:PAS domain S-box-containing protein
MAAVLLSAEFVIACLVPALGLSDAVGGYLVRSILLALVGCAGLYAVGLHSPSAAGEESTRRYLSVEKRTWALVVAQIALLGAVVCVQALSLSSQNTAAIIETHMDRQIMRAAELTHAALAESRRRSAGSVPSSPAAPLEEVAAEQAVFERVMRGLLDGDSELGLPPCRANDVRAQLESVQTAWAAVAELLKELRDNKNVEDPPAFRARLEAARQKLLGELEAADRKLEAHYRQRWVKTWRLTLLVLVCASVVVAVTLAANFARLVAGRRRLDKQVAEQTAALARSEACFRTVIDASKDAIVVIGPDGRITLFNPAAEQMFARSAAQMLGQPLDLLMPEEYRERHRKYVEDYFRHGGSCRGVVGKTVELPAVRADGTRFPIELSLSEGRTDHAPFVLAIMRDISQRKRLEQRLVHAQKLESIGQLAAGIAHEINTPTQFVGDNMHFLQRSFADLLSVVQQCERAVQAAQCGGLPADAAAEIAKALKEIELDYLVQEIPRAIEQSLDGLQRVTKIVRAMKEFSHPGSEQRQPTDINRAIESTITVARNAWKYVANMVTDFDPSLPLVPVLPGDFNQAILNILINAADAIGEVVGCSGTKGTITVRTRRVGDWAEIRIRDTGTGIPEEIRGKIFDPFFTTKPTGRGTGQGLAIVHSVVVEKHQGTIDVETQVGKGTTFIIRLPLYEPIEPGETREQESDTHS